MAPAAGVGFAGDVAGVAAAGRADPCADWDGAGVGGGCAGDAGRGGGSEAGGVDGCERGGAGRGGVGCEAACSGAVCASGFLPANTRRRKSISATLAPIRKAGRVRVRERAERPLARLWTHGLPACSRGTVAKSCAQGAAPAKHRGTAGWLRAGAPSRSPLWPRTAFLSTAGRGEFDIVSSFCRPAVHHWLLARLLELRMRPELTRQQRKHGVPWSAGGRGPSRPAHKVDRRCGSVH